MTTETRQIELRGGTAAQWTAANPVLGPCEPGVETDTGKVKYGDGVTAWASLAYSGVAPVTSVNGLTGAVVLPTDPIAATAGLRTLGSGATQAAAGNDPRLQGFTPTAVKTANYTLAAGDFALFDTTSGALTATLPTAPADKTRCGIKLVAGSNVLNIACGGSDHFNTTSGPTSGTFPLLNQGAIYQYNASTAVWVVQADDLPLSQLDLRYAAIGGGFAPTHTGAAATGAYRGVTAAGAPTTGTWAVGDWVTDQAGKRWTCTVAGTPGTWVQEPGTGTGGGAQPPGLPYTLNPMNMTGASPVPAANRGWYMRALGQGTITKIGLAVAVSSGNISVAVCRGTGGRSAPTTRLATSGAVACPAAGYREIALGGSVTVDPATDFLAISADNTTATFYGIPGGSEDNPASSSIALGMNMTEASAHPIPSPPAAGTLLGMRAGAIILLGIA